MFCRYAGEPRRADSDGTPWCTNKRRHFCNCQFDHRQINIAKAVTYTSECWILFGDFLARLSQVIGLSPVQGDSPLTFLIQSNIVFIVVYLLSTSL